MTSVFFCSNRHFFNWITGSSSIMFHDYHHGPSAKETSKHYQPITRTPIVMLVTKHITSRLPLTFSPSNLPTSQTTSLSTPPSFALYLSLAHLEIKNTHVKMLFLDFMTTFNNIILIGKLGPLGFSTPLCK